MISYNVKIICAWASRGSQACDTNVWAQFIVQMENIAQVKEDLLKRIMHGWAIRGTEEAFDLCGGHKIIGGNRFNDMCDGIGACLIEFKEPFTVEVVCKNDAFDRLPEEEALAVTELTLALEAAKLTENV